MLLLSVIVMVDIPIWSALFNAKVQMSISFYTALRFWFYCHFLFFVSPCFLLEHDDALHHSYFFLVMPKLGIHTGISSNQPSPPSIILYYESNSLRISTLRIFQTPNRILQNSLMSNRPETRATPFITSYFNANSNTHSRLLHHPPTMQTKPSDSYTPKLPQRQTEENVNGKSKTAARIKA